MTLHKAIVAANRYHRFAFKCPDCGDLIPDFDGKTDYKYDDTVHCHGCEYTDDFCMFKMVKVSTLPAKPMSEDEISLLIYDAQDKTEGYHPCKNIIRALRDAGVLYVDEKK